MFRRGCRLGDEGAEGDSPACRREGGRGPLAEAGAVRPTPVAFSDIPPASAECCQTHDATAVTETSTRSHTRPKDQSVSGRFLLTGRPVN